MDEYLLNEYKSNSSLQAEIRKLNDHTKKELREAQNLDAIVVAAQNAVERWPFYMLWSSRSRRMLNLKVQIVSILDPQRDVLRPIWSYLCLTLIIADNVLKHDEKIGALQHRFALWIDYIKSERDESKRSRYSLKFFGAMVIFVAEVMQLYPLTPRISVPRFFRRGHKELSASLSKTIDILEEITNEMWRTPQKDEARELLDKIPKMKLPDEQTLEIDLKSVLSPYEQENWQPSLITLAAQSHTPYEVFTHLQRTRMQYQQDVHFLNTTYDLLTPITKELFKCFFLNKTNAEPAWSYLKTLKLVEDQRTL